MAGQVVKGLSYTLFQRVILVHVAVFVDGHLLHPIVGIGILSRAGIDFHSEGSQQGESVRDNGLVVQEKDSRARGYSEGVRHGCAGILQAIGQADGVSVVSLLKNNIKIVSLDAPPPG